MKTGQFRTIVFVTLITFLFIVLGCSTEIEEDETSTLTGITISGTTSITATGSTALTAIPSFTGSDDASHVTYSWKISDGAEYASISSSGNTATVTGANTTLWSQSITVFLSATYNGITKSMTKVISVSWLEKDEHLITYLDSDGSSISGMSPLTFKETESIDLSSTSPTKTGYTFIGWSVSQNTTSIITGWSVGDYTDSVTLYARWNVIAYNITYNMNKENAKNTDDAVVSYTVESDTFTLPTPNTTTENTIFAGWYATETFDVGTRLSQVEQGTTGDIVLYAKWLFNAVDAYSAAEYISNLTKDSTVNIVGELTEDLLKEISTAIKAGSYKITLDLSNTTGLTLISDESAYTNATFFNNANLAGIVLPDTLTYIGKYTFYNCTGLSSITIPDSVTGIGFSVFSGCSSLEEITIPFVGTSATTTTVSTGRLFGYIFGTSSYTGGTKTVQYYSSIDYATYYIPSALKKVTVTGGRGLYAYSFYGCSTLTDIIIPDTITFVKTKVFSGCESLENINIPNNVSKINEATFDGCKSLTKVTIPDSVTSIGDWAFRDCTSLLGITIPSKVTSIGNGAFSNCSSLESIQVANGNTVYDSRNNCNAIIETSSNTLLKGCKNSTIPDTVKTIGYSAFSSCTGLTNVTIPDSVTTIENSVFLGCTELTDITIGDSVTYIDSYAFYGCTGLKSIIIPNSVIVIEDYAFSSCTELTSVTIPDSVISIGHYVFSGCTSLASITIPSNLDKIGKYAFYKCPLTSVTFNDTETWYYTNSSEYTDGKSISPTDLANTSTAAIYLKSTYCEYYWCKK